MRLRGCRRHKKALLNDGTSVAIRGAHDFASLAAARSFEPIGKRRMRLPVAAKMALASGGTLGSPTPVGGRFACDDVNFNFGRFEHPQHGRVVEIVLLNTAVLERDFGFECSGQAKNDAAFHLRLDDVGIDGAPAINGANHTMHTYGAVLFDRSLHNLGDVAIERKMRGDAAGRCRRRKGPCRNRISCPSAPKESGITQSSGVEGSSSTETDFPFKKKEVKVRLARLQI